MDQVDGTTNLITSQQGHEGLYSRVKTDPPLAAPCQGHDVDEDELSDETYNIQSEFNKLYNKVLRSLVNKQVAVRHIHMYKNPLFGSLVWGSLTLSLSAISFIATSWSGFILNTSSEMFLGIWSVSCTHPFSTQHKWRACLFTLRMWATMHTTSSSCSIRISSHFLSTFKIISLSFFPPRPNLFFVGWNSNRAAGGSGVHCCPHSQCKETRPSLMLCWKWMCTACWKWMCTAYTPDTQKHFRWGVQNKSWPGGSYEGNRSDQLSLPLSGMSQAQVFLCLTE